MSIPPASESDALIILVPEAEKLVGPYRTKYDPVAPLGMPPHVTLMFPFVACDALDESARNELRARLFELPVFVYEFRNTGVFPGVLYLRPENADPFLEAMTVARSLFPDLVPYGDDSLQPVPHLTVAHAASDVVLREIRRSFEAALEEHGPVSGRATAATLMQHSGTLWEASDAFRFHGREG